MVHTNEELIQIIKQANEAVKQSGITDKDLKQEAFKFALNYQYQIFNPKTKEAK
jgi:hypothetical protein